LNKAADHTADGEGTAAVERGLISVTSSRALEWIVVGFGASDLLDLFGGPGVESSIDRSARLVTARRRHRLVPSPD
jgi:hypothetical protein